MNEGTSADLAANPGRRWLPLVESRSLSDLGLLALRVALGFELFAHGMQKFDLFGGWTTFTGQHVSGIDAIEAQGDFLALFGYDPSLALSYFLTITEVIAGLLLMAGFLTPLAAAALIGDMINLIFGLGWQMGWFGGEKGPGYELAVVMLLAGAAVALIGPGRYSVDSLLGWRLRGLPLGVLGIALGIVVGFAVLVAFGPGFGGADLPSAAGGG